MTMTATRLAFAAAVAAGLSASANADTLTGQFGYSHLKPINITSPLASGDVYTVQFNWTRQDAPGDGVDALIPSEFHSACIEPQQGISPGTSHTFTVVTPEAYGYSPLQVSMLQRLWADYYPTIDNADASAAFQMSVWEVIHDVDVDLGEGLFRVNSEIPATTLAASWLGTISSESYSTLNPLPDLAVLQSASAQDQITVIPSPSAGAFAGLAILGVLSRRRRS